MGFFRWFGRDDLQRPCSGLMAARTFEQGIKGLSKFQVAIEDWYEVPPAIIPRISRSSLSLFLQQLALLLKSGIRLYDALLIVRSTTTHRSLAAVIDDCAAGVQEGIPLSTVCQCYPMIFDVLTVHIIASGEQSGSLASALEYRAYHLNMVDQFYKNVRTSLMIPGITFLIFIGIVMLFFLVIIPQFQTMFVHIHTPLPQFTTLLFRTSDWLRSGGLLMGAGVMLVLSGMSVLLIRSTKGQNVMGALVLHIPLVKQIIINFSRTLFFKTWAMLMRGGVHGISALTLAAKTITVPAIREELLLASEDLVAGSSLVAAFSRTKFLSAQEILAFITVGESSGKLSSMADQLGDVYRERVQRLLKRMSRLVQPAVLIILGVCVALLFSALYEPLFTLSTSIG